jgi:cyclopropane fatty-acyl-phospholipid synthase-like methyltransferase
VARQHIRQPSLQWCASHRSVSRCFDLVEAIGLMEYLGALDWTFRYGRLVASRKRLAGAVTLFRNAYELVRPGGVLVFANMLVSHPQLAFTLNVVQWPHIQRLVATLTLGPARDRVIASRRPTGIGARAP